MKNSTIEEVTIKIPKVSVNNELFRLQTKQTVLKNLSIGKIEDSSLEDRKYLNSSEAGITNQFIDMLGLAFFQHKPIIITPDDLWLLVCQGFAEHLKNNSSFFRNRVVSHKGQKTIKVEINSFIKGEKNSWEEVFPLFEQEIKNYLKDDLHSSIVQNFSTTSIKERTAYQIAFMDSISKYFKYECFSMCGIPQIKIKGSVQDYEKMILALRQLKKYNLEWWINPLDKIISKIIDTLKGNIDIDFWKSIYHEDSHSGMPNAISGWISLFFPYVKNTKFWHLKKGFIKNPHIFGKKKILEPIDFPSGISKVPFLWNYLGEKYNMNFISGFIGITESNETNFLRTHINWIITED